MDNKKIRELIEDIDTELCHITDTLISFIEKEEKTSKILYVQYCIGKISVYLAQIEINLKN